MAMTLRLFDSELTRCACPPREHTWRIRVSRKGPKHGGVMSNHSDVSTNFNFVLLESQLGQGEKESPQRHHPEY